MERSVFEFLQLVPDEQSAENYFKRIRWSDCRIKCPFCEYRGVHAAENRKPMSYRCRKCRKHFSLRTKTIMNHSRIPIQKWLLTAYLLTSMRKGLSSIYLSKILQVTQKTAWFMAQRIYEAWSKSVDGFRLSRKIEEGRTNAGENEANTDIVQKCMRIWREVARRIIDFRKELYVNIDGFRRQNKVNVYAHKRAIYHQEQYGQT